MNSLIVLAAGSGSRVGAKINKMYLPIGGKPLLLYTLEQVLKADCIDEIIVAVAETDMELFDNYIKKDLFNIPIKSVIGGMSRQESVKNALKKVSPESERIFIHDGARPYINPEDIQKINEALDEVVGAVLVSEVTDTVKIRDGTGKIRTHPREEVFLAQTPQGFHKEILSQMYNVSDEVLLACTDDSQLLERMGISPRLVPAQYANKKITTKDDYESFIQYILRDGIVRVGIGYDIHRFADKRKLMLGGIQIPWDKGLLGHSDADVVAHALADALLGAAGKNDIGTYFPDTDITWKDLSGTLLLKKVRDILAECQCIISNIDITVIAEKPKLKNFILQMKKQLSEALCVPENYIGIKATTNEGMDAIGEEKGIAAFAIVSITERMK